MLWLCLPKRRIYKGIRRSDRGFKGELPTEELNERLNRIRCIVRKICGEEQERIKSMMITHKILSRQQGYEELLDIIGDKSICKNALR